jgi:hypothetical protein
MLRLILFVVVVVVALVRGGSLRNFATLRLRWPALAIAGFVLQLLIFTPFAEAPLVAWATVPLYLLSMAILTLWVALNWRIPGMVLIGAGLLMNFAAVAANDGKMPVSADALRVAGRYEEIIADNPTISKHIVADDDTVRLWVLTDIIGIPKQVPFPAVWSIGDVALNLGVAVLCFRTIRGAPDLALTGVAREPAIVLTENNQ